MTNEQVIAAYKLKLASNPDGERDFMTVEISHPLLSQTYRIVVGMEPLVATLETGEVATFEPFAMEVKDGGNNNDMDQQASYTLPDVANLLDDEMSRIPLDDDRLPVFIFRGFVSTDLSAPCRGPIVYDLQSLTQSKGVFTADVGVPRLNQRSTGILMTPAEIPLLRGILS